MEAAIEKLKNVADIFDLIENELSNISSEDCLQVNEVQAHVHNHEKEIHAALSIASRAAKNINSDETSLNYEVLPEFEAPITRLVCDHLSSVGSGDINGVISMEYSPDSVSEKSRELREWLKNDETAMIDTISTKAYPHCLLFFLSVKRKFYSTSLESEHNAVEYLNEIDALIHSKKSLGSLVDCFDDVSRDLTSSLITSDRYIKWQLFQTVEKDIQDIVLSRKNTDESALDTLVSDGYSAMVQSLQTLRAYQWNTDRSSRASLSVTGHIGDRFHNVLVCPVTKEEISPGSEVVILPCKHVMSVAAVNQMEVSDLKCPCCKSNYKLSEIALNRLV